MHLGSGCFSRVTMDDRYGVRSPYGSNPSSQYKGVHSDQGKFTMNIVKCPTDAFALSNFVSIAPGQLDPRDHYIIVNDEFVFTVR